MNFDPFEFYSGNDDFFNYGYDNGYGNDFGSTFGGIMQSFYWAVGLLIAAIVIGIVVNFTFLRRKNEGRFHGFWGKVYNFLSLNRFYSEGIIKLLSVITFFVLTVMGIYMICTGGVLSGLLVITLGNVAARLCYELTMMFVIFCKKTVSMDKKLSTISKFYDDMEDWDYHDASDEGMKEDDTRAEAVEEMEDAVDDDKAFEPVEATPQAEEAPQEETAQEEEAHSEAEVISDPKEAEFQEKLKAVLGDPDGLKYGYDEECKTCDNWSDEEQDCYCPDDCLTCDKPDQETKKSGSPKVDEVTDPEAE